MDMLAQGLIQGVLVGSTYGLIALGMGLIYSVSGVVNFAQGDMLIVALYVALSLFAAFRFDPYVSVVVMLPIMAIAGALLYLLLIRRIMTGHAFMAVQMKLALSFVLESSLLMIYGGDLQHVPSAYEASLLILGNGLLVVRTSLVIAFAVSCLLSMLLYWMLNRTDLGREIRAVNQNMKAAVLMGIDVERVRTLTFAAGGALLAIAAVLLSPGLSLSPTAGLQYTMLTIMVLVLGGMTNFFGILLGGVIIGVVEAMGGIYVSGTAGLIVPYAIFAIFLLLRPHGLLSRR